MYPDSIAGRYASEYVEGPQTKDNFRLTRQYGATAPVDWRLLAFSEVGALSPQEAADFDLCEMIRAPVFVRGKAGFAALAEGLRDFAHKETVSDLAGLDGAFVGQRERDNWAAIGT